jgi:hypothetical protein
MPSLGRRSEGWPGSPSCQPPQDPAPPPPPPQSAPFSTSSIHRGRERVTHAPRPPPALLLPLLPLLLPPPPFSATLARSVRPSPSAPCPTLRAGSGARKRERSGTSRLPGPTAANACASRTPSSTPVPWCWTARGHLGAWGACGVFGEFESIAGPCPSRKRGSWKEAKRQPTAFRSR